MSPTVETAPKPTRPTTYWKGNKVEYTGKVDESDVGTTFYQVRVLEGSEKGKLREIVKPPQRERNHAMSKDTTQLTMFTHEDLPLFSGTAPTTKASVFTPKAAHRQSSMADCALCLDTGVVDSKPCWCKAQAESEEPRL